MYRFIILLIAICIGMMNHINAFVVKSIDELKNDISARTNSRMDKNNNPCALIRLNLPTLDQLTFGNMVVGEVTQLPGEYVLYLSPDTKQLTYSVKGVQNTIDFSDYNIDIEGKKTYRIILKEDNAPTAAFTSAYITANYDNQIVLVDGIPMGETPVLIESIEPGQHTIGIPNTNGITMKDTTVLISNGIKNNIRLTLHQEESETIPISIKGWGEGYAEVGWGLYNEIKNGKKGLFDYTGKQIIPCRYDYILSSDYGARDIYYVGINNPIKEGYYLMGLYSEQNGEILPCQYDKVYELIDDYNFAVIKDGKCGIVDSNGKFIVPIEYDFYPLDALSISGNKDSWYSVVIQDHKKGVINNYGNLVIPIQYEDIKIRWNRSSNTPYFIVKKKTAVQGGDIIRMGVLDLNDEWIISPDFYSIDPGHNSDTFIFEERAGGRKGLIDRFGNKKYLPAEYSRLDYAGNNYYTVYKQGAGFGLVDGNFNLKSNNFYDTYGNSAPHFSNHFLCVGKNNNVFINTLGQEVINGDTQNFKYVELKGDDPITDWDNLDFNKVAYFKVTGNDDTEGIYDINGNVIIPTGTYVSAERYIEDSKPYYVLKTKDGESIFSDSNLNTIFSIPNDADLVIERVKDGIVLVKGVGESNLGEKIYASTDGEILFSEIITRNIAYETEQTGENYIEDNDEVEDSNEFGYTYGQAIHEEMDQEPIKDGLGFVQIGDRYGFIDKNGKFPIPLIYTAVTPFRNGVTFVRDQVGNWHKIYRKDLK